MLSRTRRSPALPTSSTVFARPVVVPTLFFCPLLRPHFHIGLCAGLESLTLILPACKSTFLPISHRKQGCPLERKRSEAVLKGVNDQFQAVRYLQLAKNGREMVADRRLTDDQAFGNLLVAQPFANQGDHFALPGRQRGNFRCLGIFGRRALVW